jgi:hypothetical protein
LGLQAGAVDGLAVIGMGEGSAQEQGEGNEETHENILSMANGR